MPIPREKAGLPLRWAATSGGIRKTLRRRGGAQTTRPIGAMPSSFPGTRGVTCSWEPAPWRLAAGLARPSSTATWPI